MRIPFTLLQLTGRSVKLAYRNYVFQSIVTVLTTAVMIISVSTWYSLKAGSADFVNKLASGTQLVITSPTSQGVDVEVVRNALQPSDYNTLVVSRFDKGKLDNEEITLIGIDIIGEKIQSELSEKETNKDTFLLLGSSVKTSANSIRELELGKNRIEIETRKSSKFRNQAANAINHGNFVVIPLMLYRTLTEDNPQMIFVGLPSGMTKSQGQKNISDVLPFYEVREVTEYINSLNRQYDLMASVSYLFSLCFFMGSVFLIYISINTEITKRRKQFLILRLVGARKYSLFVYGIVESIILNIIPLAIGFILANAGTPYVLQQIPPALLTNLPITPVYMFNYGIFFLLGATVLTGICFSRCYALQKNIKKIDNGLNYLRAVEQLHNSKRRLILSAASVLVLFVLALMSTTYARFIVGLMLLASIPLIISCLERILNAFVLAYGKGKQGIALLKIARNLKKRHSVYVLVAVAVAMPVSALLSTQALINKGDSLVESLRKNDYYLQSSTVDTFPIKEFATKEHLKQVEQLQEIKKIVPGLLLPFSSGKHQFTLQIVSPGTNMPAAINAGEAALKKIFNKTNNAILTRKAADSLNVRVGDKIDIPLQGEKVKFTVVGISDYIGVNDGQIVLSYANVCEKYGLCNASYIELQTVNHKQITKKTIQDIDFLVETSELHLITAEEEYAVLGQSIAATSSLSVILAIQLSFIMLIGLFSVLYSELESRLGEIDKLYRMGCISQPKRLFYGSGIVKEYLSVILTATAIGVALAILWHKDFNLYLEKSISISNLSNEISLSSLSAYVFVFWGMISLLTLLAIYISTKTYSRKYR